MKSMKIKMEQSRHRASGFSLIEMMIVVAILLIMAGVSIFTLMPALRQQHVTNAYNTSMAAMRLARDSAVAQQTSYEVDFAHFVAPNTLDTITVKPTLAGAGFQGEQITTTYQLPLDVKFDAEPGLPAAAPDGFGAGTVAIDFGYKPDGTGGGQSKMWFCPDGSAEAASPVGGTCTANWSGGAVYLALPGNLMSSRALTLWGATGRIHGWRLVTKGGVNSWQRQ